MKIYAVSGYKRSGKDTTAEHLVKQYGFQRVAFADPLKDSVAKEFSIPREHCDDPAFKEKPILHLPVSPKDAFSLNLSRFMFREFRDAEGNVPMEPVTDASNTFLGLMGRNKVAQLYWTPRALCILKGSVNRTVRSDFWVKAAIDNVNFLVDNFEGTPGFTCNFVISDLRYQSEVNQLRQAFGKDLITVRVNRFEDCTSNDPSERDLDNAQFDVVLDNKGTLEEFLDKVDVLVKGD